MNETLALPPRLVLRDLMLTAFSQKARIALIFFCIVALSIVIAVQIKPDYKAKSSLLVLMGTEHAFRPAAGQLTTPTGGPDSEEILRTESNILTSDDLHRTVIRDIGIAKMYPKLLEKPGPIGQWIVDTKRFVTDSLGLTEKATGTGPNDPMAMAVGLFARNLTITVDKKSSVIALEFTNPDKYVAADALRLLEAQYLVLRAKLYNDVQAPIVLVQRNAVGRQMSDADAALNSFKQQHDISNFAERRAILLQQQGALETALTKSEATIAERSARLAQLNQTLGAVAGGKKGAPNAAAALQGMVQAYQKRQEDAQTRYRGSPAVDDARRQMLERETDIARMQATQAYGVQADRNKTEADLRASLGAHDVIAGQLTTLNKEINSLDADESQLHELERNRAILEDNYKAVSKILDERQTVEAVEAHRESSVRVIQPPRVPALPQPTRRLILLAGIVISMLLSIASVLVSHFLRAIYLRPEALEMDTGLTVLTSVPEMRAIGGPSSSVLVVPA
ncbi:GumC family protein [Rhodopila sp.]|uniref:GumC family protein n=1 Tax=Rhodopila sp. TaxID=2480087 RepID=UPI003D121F13